MNKRLTKQILISTIFLLIFISLLYSVYAVFIKSKPSCFDDVLNQNEEGIDCGGICASCEDVYPEKISVLNIDYLPSDNGYYNIAAKIKNNNQNYGSGRVPYKFQLYDSGGKIIGEKSGVTLILPNQTKFITELKISVSSIVNSVDLSFGNINWIKPNKELPQLFVFQKEYVSLDDGSGYAQTKGIILNRSKLSFSKVYIDILMYSNNNLVGINATEINDLLSNQERSFSVIWPKKIENNITAIEIEVETDIFSDYNIIK